MTAAIFQAAIFPAEICRDTAGLTDVRKLRVQQNLACKLVSCTGYLLFRHLHYELHKTPLALTPDPCMRSIAFPGSPPVMAGQHHCLALLDRQGCQGWGSCNGDDSLYQCRCLSHCLWAEVCAFAGTGWADDGVILT